MVYNVELSRIMTTTVVTVQPDDSMTKVQEIFKKHLFHHLPVLDDGKIIGIISRSDYDKLCHSFTLFNHKSSKLHNDNLMKSLLASEVMTTQVITLKPTDTVQKAASYFRENTFHAIPVVDESENLMGLVTTYDLLNYAFFETKHEDLALKDTL